MMVINTDDSMHVVPENHVCLKYFRCLSNMFIMCKGFFLCQSTISCMQGMIQYVAMEEYIDNWTEWRNGTVRCIGQRMDCRENRE